MRTLNYLVTQADDGRQIKRLARARMGLSSHMLAQLKVRDGLRIDGVPVRGCDIARAGQTISALVADECAHENRADMENAPVNVVYEDEDILVIDKEAPMATQSSSRQPANTLENRLSYRYGSDPNFVFRPVNRLDKGTSGLMLAAKHAHAQWALASTLHTPDFVRGYLAVTQGVPDPPCGMIDAPIGKKDGATIRREVRADGKPSQTLYETLRTANGRALLSLTLKTGRTHQIRVHLSYIGCPVFGDFLYGEEREDVLKGRFALHSAYVSFIHPVSGQRMTFTSPLPDALEALMHDGY